MEEGRKNQPWDVPKPSDGLLMQVIEQRCTNLRSIYRTTRPKIGDDGAIETPAQIGERVAGNTEHTLLVNRQRRRRVTVSPQNLLGTI